MSQNAQKESETSANPITKLSPEQQPDLQDLPEDKPERPPILSPKLIILIMLSTIFVFKNLYNYVMNPNKSTQQVPEVDSWDNAKIVWERVWGYLVLTILLFIMFIYLRRQNQNHDEKILKEIYQKEDRAQSSEENTEESDSRKMEKQQENDDEKQPVSNKQD